MIKASKTIISLTAFTMLAACGSGGSKDRVTPTIGKRVDIMGTRIDTTADPALAGQSVILPSARTNSDWQQPGGSASKAPGHVSLGSELSRVWTAKVAGSSNRARLAAAPITVGGKLYAIGTNAEVMAFDANSGRELWSSRFSDKEANKATLFGGGVASDGINIYATNGFGDVAALNKDTGEVLWKKRPSGPLRGSPTLSNGNLYVMTQDNQIYALNARTGSSEWNEAGAIGISGIFGVAAPAASDGTIVAGFSSGELAAYRYENGRSLWNDTLSRTRMSLSVSELSDVDAAPVIDRGRVYALGQGGRMAAYDLDRGQRIWELNIAGIATPVVAGEWVFVLTDDARVLCVSRSSGKIRWISQLAKFKSEKKKEGAITWRGPILAGNRLITTNSLGQIWSIEPEEGVGFLLHEVKDAISVPPIVANNKLYILDDSGTISAYQ